MFRMAFAAVLLLTFGGSVAQQPASLSRHDQALRKGLEAFPLGTVLRVKVKGKPDIVGTLLSKADQSIELKPDEDTQASVITFAEIKTVEEYRNSHRRHPSSNGNTAAHVVGGVVVIGVITFLLVALANDK